MAIASVEKAFYVIHHPTDNEELEAAKKFALFEAFLPKAPFYTGKRFRQ